MKLRQLQCLCAIVDADFNISRASAALHASQPAVSKQFQHLEDELGLNLVLRKAGRIVGLTEYGIRVELWARSALQYTDNIRALAQENRGEAGGSLIVATSHTHAKYVLLPVIHAFKELFPLVRIAVLQGSPDQIATLVSEGNADIGVVSTPSRLPKDVIAIPFRSSAMNLITPVGHELLKEKLLTLKSLSAHPMILISPSPLTNQILQKFNEAGLKVNVAFETLDADVTQDFVSTGLGISILPAFALASAKSSQLRRADVGHLFNPQVSTLLVRQKARLARYAYIFLEELDAALSRARIDSLLSDFE